MPRIINGSIKPAGQLNGGVISNIVDYSNVLNKPTLNGSTISGNTQLTLESEGGVVSLIQNGNTISSFTAQDVGAATTIHTHGNLTTDGKIGTTAGKVVITEQGGVLNATDTIEGGNL
jgi:hypothetical protein